MTLIVQGTPEWYAVRLGKITGSRIADMMAKGKGNAISAGYANYRAELVLERLTGKVTMDGFVSNYMAQGTALEPFARDAYCRKYGVLISQVGFFDHPTIANFGVSPDGLVDDDGLIEIKCPNEANHMATIIGGTPDKYVQQMQANMIVCGREWCDYISYNPNFPLPLQLAVFRNKATPEYQKTIEESVVAFDTDINSWVDRLRAVAEGRDPDAE